MMKTKTVCKTDVKKAARYLQDAAIFYKARATKPKEEWRAEQMKKLGRKLEETLVGAFE